MVDLSVIVINWNTRQLLADCLTAIIETATELDYEIIVVDNGSSDGSQAMLHRHFPQVRLLQNSKNVGFAKANNQGVATSQGRYALLLNSDAFVTPGAMQQLIRLADENPGIGLVGAQLLNLDGTFQASYTPFPNLWQEFLILSSLGRLVYGRWYPSRRAEEAKGPQQVDYVEGACMLVRRAAYETVGGLAESYFMYAEEVDLCYGLRQKGWQVWYQPAAKVTHLGGGSSQNRPTQREGDLYRSRVQFFRKHYGDSAARLLKLQIYGFVLLKIAGHRFLRSASRGRYGRPVIPIRNLYLVLKEC